MKKLIMFLAVFLSAFSFVTSASAIPTSYEAGTIYNTVGVSTEVTSMTNMVGMEVTAKFSGTSGLLSEETVTWTDSGAKGSTYNWDLIVSSGDTFSADWSLTNNETSYALVSLYIDAGLGNTVFDVIYDENKEYSQNSENGWSVSSGPDYVSSATYRGAVTVDNTWYDELTDTNRTDLYNTLTLSIRDTFFKTGDVGAVLTFRADTDKLVSTVPEPATFFLFGLGVLGVAGVSRKKQ